MARCEIGMMSIGNIERGYKLTITTKIFPVRLLENGMLHIIAHKNKVIIVK